MANKRRRKKFIIKNEFRFFIALGIVCILIGVIIWLTVLAIGELKQVFSNNNETFSNGTLIEIDVLEGTIEYDNENISDIFIPTPTPIITPSPTITPNSTPHVTTDGYITKNGVNFREQSNTDSKILDVLSSLTPIKIIETYGNWYKIQVNGNIGWVSGEFIEIGEVPQSVKSTPKPTPTPTPRYGKWERDDYLLLATTIYCEQGGTDLEGSIAVGWVIRNRLEDKSRWGDDTWLDVISRSGQFSVYSTKSSSKFQKTLKSIGKTNDNEYYEVAKRAARYVMQDRSKYKIPQGVQYFHAHPAPKGWRKNFYRTIGGNDFFY